MLYEEGEEMLKCTGIPTEKDMKSIIPPKERLAKGPVAIIECFENIPCNPCYTSCPRGAIKEFKDINDIPKLDYEICNGCSICVTHCPGLAIFVIDESYSETEALVKIPYELTPLPTEGTFVTGTDRGGNPICRAKVVKVQNTKFQDRTPMVTIAVPKDLSMVVRFFKLEDYFDDNTIICRCEELTLGEIREFIRKGYTTVEEIKRISRAGMGPCQGRTCQQLIMDEIARATGTRVEEVSVHTYRPPVLPIKLGKILGGEKNE